MTTKPSNLTVLSRPIAKSKMARLAAIILAGASPMLASAQQQSIFMANPSFEVGYVNQSYPGYQGSIPGWLVTVNTMGINNSTGPFWDNSGPVDGSYVYFQQGDGFLEQTNSGFQVGQTYWLQFFANARHQQSDTPVLYIFEYASTINTTHLLEQGISQSVLGPYGTAANGVPFTFINVPFVAGSTNGVLYLDKLSASGNDSGNASVLYDGFSMIQRSASDVVIMNPSFEASGTNQTAPGYMTAIAGWKTQGGGSLAIAQQTGTFTDNGTIPDGVNVLCLTSGEGVSQTLYDLAVGETYQLSIYLNATAATASPSAVIQIGGNTAFSGPVTAVGGANSYAYKSYTFTASTTSALLTISNATPTATASTLLVDNVRVLGFPGSITVANPSFEQNGAALAPAYPGYCTIPGWTFTGDNVTEIGINPANWSGAEAFWDNGGTVDQSYVGFAQSDGTLSQPLNGFLVGQTYWIQFFANSRSTYTQNDTPVISVYEGASTAGPLAVASGMTITPAGTYPTAGTGAPFDFINVPFVAAATNGTLGFAKISASGTDSGGASWTFDGVSVIQRSPNDVVIANPSFEASGNTSLQTPGDYQGYVSSIAGWTTTNIGGGGGALIVGQLGGPYVDNGTVPDGANVLGLKGLIGVSQVLQGLVPGNSYTLTLYLNERAWDAIWGAYVTAQVTIDGQTAFSAQVTPSGTSGTFNPYQFVSYNFVADNTNVTLTIANINPDSVQGTMLVDNVRVVATAPTVVQLSAIYNGTTTMGNGSLTIANNANGTNLTLLGAAVLAGKNAGSEAIISQQGTTPALVQTATGNSGSSASTTIPVTLATAPVNGDTMIAVISTRGTASDEVTSISQTGATWTRAVASAADTHGTTTEIWYAPNVSSAGTGVTITQASLESAAVVMEYSGVLTAASPLDQTKSSTGGSSTAAVTGTTTATAQGGELWIGGIGLVNSTYTLTTLPLKSFSTVASAASTSATAANNAAVYALARYATTAATANSGSTISTASFWSGAIATFKQGGLTLSGIAAGSYTLSGVNSVTVTPKPLTVSGLTVPSSKVYDGTTTAVVSGSPGTLATAEAVGAGTTSDGKPYTGDTVSTTGTATGTYNDPSVALASTVTIGGETLTGVQASDYSVKPGTAAATITPRALTLSGSTPYTGTATAASGNLSIANNVDGANLTLSGIAALTGKGTGTQNAIYFATPTLVQSATGNAGSSAASSFTVPLGIAPVDGNTLIAVISTRGNALDEVTSVAQNSGSVPWTRAVATAADSHNISTEIWYAPNVSGAGTTVTITTGTSLLSAAVIMEYSGLYTSSSLDQTKSNTGGSTTAATTGTSTATGQTAELWIGGIGFTNNGYTLGTILNGFSTVASAHSTSSISAGTNDTVYALARITNSIGTASSGGTISTASYWSGAIATFGAAMPGSLTLGGSAAGNYTLIGLGGSVTVTAKPLTMSGLSVPASKPYDGTTTAVVSGSPGSLQTAEAAGAGSSSDGAPYIGDAVSITGTATGTYNDPSVALASTVTYGGLSLTGAQSSYYSLTIQSPASATITLAAPTVNCPANINDTNLIGQCGNMESFAATTNNTGGAITLTYTLPGPTVITSPYFFPVGTNTVTATVTNSSGTNSCTFTVTVNESPLPAPGPFSLYAVDGSTASMPIAKMLSVASPGSGGNTLSVTSVTPTTGTGATVGMSGGMLTYTPLGNYVGTDTINYVLTDGCGTAPGTISVVVSASGAGNNLGYGAVVGGKLYLQYFGVVGTNYWLQVSSPTATGPWSDVTVGNSGGAVNANPVPASGSGMINYIVYPVLPSPAFYRTSTTP